MGTVTNTGRAAENLLYGAMAANTGVDFSALFKVKIDGNFQKNHKNS